MLVREWSDLSYLTSFQRKPSLGSQVSLEFATSLLMRNKGSAWKGRPRECPKNCITPLEIILYLETNCLMQELFSPQLRIQKHNSELRDFFFKKRTFLWARDWSVVVIVFMHYVKHQDANGIDVMISPRTWCHFDVFSIGNAVYALFWIFKIPFQCLDWLID